MLTRLIAPYGSNHDRISASVAPKARFPTKIFFTWASLSIAAGKSGQDRKRAAENRTNAKMPKSLSTLNVTRKRARCAKIASDLVRCPGCASYGSAFVPAPILRASSGRLPSQTVRSLGPEANRRRVGESGTGAELRRGIDVTTAIVLKGAVLHMASSRALALAFHGASAYSGDSGRALVANRPNHRRPLPRRRGY